MRHKTHTVFILINAPGALQFMRAYNVIHETKFGQIYKHFVSCPRAILCGNCPPFPMKSRRGIY